MCAVVARGHKIATSSVKAEEHHSSELLRPSTVCQLPGAKFVGLCPPHSFCKTEIGWILAGNLRAACVAILLPTVHAGASFKRGYFDAAYHGVPNHWGFGNPAPQPYLAAYAPLLLPYIPHHQVFLFSQGPQQWEQQRMSKPPPPWFQMMQAVAPRPWDLRERSVADLKRRFDPYFAADSGRSLPFLPDTLQLVCYSGTMVVVWLLGCGRQACLWWKRV